MSSGLPGEVGSGVVGVVASGVPSEVASGVPGEVASVVLGEVGSGMVGVVALLRSASKGDAAWLRGYDVILGNPTLRLELHER